MMAEIMGKEAGYCRGKGGSMHIADMSGGNLGANAIVGGSFGIATGAAWSAKMRGTDQVAVCFFGDGAANQGLLLETGNMASIWKLPVIYLCENNQYGEHTPMNTVTGVEHIVERASGIGIEGVQADGSDVLEMYDVISTAVKKARRGDGPTFVEAVTYRFRGHHVGDGGNYRTKEELDWWMENKDPISKLGNHLIASKLATRGRLDALEEKVEEEVVNAVEFGRNAPMPAPEQATRMFMPDVDITYREAVGQAMAEEMRRDETIFLVGEDVAGSGGIFNAVMECWTSLVRSGSSTRRYRRPATSA